MQKAFEKIKERLEESKKKCRFSKTSDTFFDHTIEIVNQVAEEYKDKLVKDIKFAIKASNTNDTYMAGLRNGMRWCLALVDGKEPKFEKVNDGWIPCERELPSEDGFYNVTVKFWHVNKPTVMSSHFVCGKWTCVALDAKDEVIAWQPLPTAYVKGE